MEPTPPPTNPTPPAQYEFTADQNQVIGGLARNMIWVAAPFVFLGILYVVAGLINLAVAGMAVYHGEPRADALVNAGFLLLAAIFVLFVGRKLRFAADRFQAITQTAGNDISHLMNGLDSLGRLFKVLAAFVRIYVILVLILLVVALVAAVVGWVRRADLQ